MVAPVVVVGHIRRHTAAVEVGPVHNRIVAGEGSVGIRHMEAGGKAKDGSRILVAVEEGHSSAVAADSLVVEDSPEVGNPAVVVEGRRNLAAGGRHCTLDPDSRT